MQEAMPFLPFRFPCSIVKQDKPPSKHRRWLRWVMYLGLFAFVLTAALVCWAWTERVVVVNSPMLRLGGDWHPQFNALDWENGVLHLKELRVTYVPRSQQVATMERIEWKPELGRLRAGNLGSVKVNGAALNLPLALFKGDAAQQGTATTAASSPWRLEALELAATKVVVGDDKHEPLLSATVQGSVRGGTSAGSFEAASIKAAEVVWQRKTVLSSFQVEAAMQDEKIAIKTGSLRGGNVDLAWIKEFSPALSEKLPPLRGGVQFEWDGHDLAFLRDGLIAGGTHEVRLKNLWLQPLADAGAVKAAAVEVKLAQDLNGLWHVQSGVLLKPEIEWTQELEAALLPKSESKQASA